MMDNRDDKIFGVIFGVIFGASSRPTMRTVESDGGTGLAVGQ